MGSGLPWLAFGLAPALVDMFDTTSEFKAAMGTWGFGAGFVEGGDGGFAVTGDGLSETGIGFAGGLVGLDDAVVGEGAAFV